MDPLTVLECNATPAPGTYVAWTTGIISHVRFYRDGLEGALLLSTLKFNLDRLHVPHITRRAA